MEVIDRINLRLAEIGKTGAEMSRALQLSNSIYSQWNTKKTKPSKKTLVRVAEYLDVPVEYLLTGKEQKSQLPTQGKEPAKADMKDWERVVEQATPEVLQQMIIRATEKLMQGG